MMFTREFTSFPLDIHQTGTKSLTGTRGGMFLLAFILVSETTKFKEILVIKKELRYKKHS